MAIKTKITRDTYRSNVKERPLRQNGLEAQYQGLDITEVDIDHAGLAIIGQGGHQTRRDIRKVRKQYIVDVPQEEHNPTAELVLLSSPALSPFDTNNWSPSFSLQDINGETFSLTDSTGLANTFRFYGGTEGICSASDPAHIHDEATCTSAGHIWTPLSSSPYENGGSLINGEIIVDTTGNNFSKVGLLESITGSIESVFPTDTFRFQLFPSGSSQRQYGISEPVPILEDKLVLILSSSVVGSSQLNATSGYLGDTNNFEDQNESHEWRLNGFLKDNSNPRMFYEDLRTDTIQSTEPHYFRSEEMMFRSPQFDASDVSEDLKNCYDQNITSIAGDPTAVPRFSTHDSAEVVIRQYPLREEIFDTYQENFQWREDIHYLSADQQTWTNMESLALHYHSSLEAHIAAMMNSNFADEQYIDPYPLSGRVDVFKRLSRIFDTHTELIFERHPFSVLDQFLDPIDDFINLQENRFPKSDVTNRDVAFEDLKGTFEEQQIVGSTVHGGEIVNDFFDQEPLENHDYIEDERWTRIDDEMLDILTFNPNRGTHIDRREWQESDYIYTATGFINSQQSGQDGIIYREMKR